MSKINKEQKEQQLDRVRGHFKSITLAKWAGTGKKRPNASASTGHSQSESTTCPAQARLGRVI